MRTVKIILPWDALVSSNKRNKRRGGRAHSKEYKTSLEACHLIAQNQVQGGPVFTDGEVRASLEFVPPDYRVRDLSNYLKAIFDALEGVAWDNDRRLTDCRYLRKEVDEDDARVEITVEKRRK